MPSSKDVIGMGIVRSTALPNGGTIAAATAVGVGGDGAVADPLFASGALVACVGGAVGYGGAGVGDGWRPLALAIVKRNVAPSRMIVPGTTSPLIRTIRPLDTSYA